MLSEASPHFAEEKECRFSLIRHGVRYYLGLGVMSNSGSNGLSPLRLLGGEIASLVRAHYPIGRSSEDLKKQADFYYRMKERHLASSRFEDTITLVDGTVLNCPPNWR
jgi:hypothetical protein